MMIKKRALQFASSNCSFKKKKPYMDFLITYHVHTYCQSTPTCQYFQTSIKMLELPI